MRMIWTDCLGKVQSIPPTGATQRLQESYAIGNETDPKDRDQRNNTHFFQPIRLMSFSNPSPEWIGVEVKGVRSDPLT
jgi:hypothetical protein